MNIGTYRRFNTKKLLKETVIKAPVECFGTSIFGPLQDGEHVCVGPDVEQERKWYAQVEVRGGMIVKVIQ